MRSMRFPVVVVSYSCPSIEDDDAHLRSFDSSTLPDEAPDGLDIEIYHHRVDIGMVASAVFRRS